MFAEERKELILEHLKENKRATISELSKLLNVSGTTVRIYLTEMEEKGELVRTHGGALFVQEAMLPEESIVSRYSKNTKEKMMIAQKAKELVEAGDTILIDTGTTCLEFAKQLKGFSDITVITNDFRIASEIQKNEGIQGIFLGGVIRNKYECTVGAEVIKALEGYSVDKVFLSASALSLTKGATTPHIENAMVEKAMMECALTKILLCDSTKMGKRTTCTFAKVEDFDCMVTDGDLAADDVAEIEKLGVKII